MGVCKPSTEGQTDMDTPHTHIEMTTRKEQIRKRRGKRQTKKKEKERSPAAVWAGGTNTAGGRLAGAEDSTGVDGALGLTGREPEPEAEPEPAAEADVDEGRFKGLSEWRPSESRAIIAVSSSAFTGVACFCSGCMQYGAKTEHH